MFISPVIWRQDFVNLTLVHSNWCITHPLTPGAKNSSIVHLLKLIKINTIERTWIGSIDVHRLVKPIDINRLIFYPFYCLYYWFRRLIFIDWACQGLTKATVLVRTTPWFVINIMFGVSSSGKAGKHSKKHLNTSFLSLWPQLRSKRSKTIFFRLFQHLTGFCHNAQRDWLRYLSGQVIPSRDVV